MIAIDKLIKKIKEMDNPTVIGLDLRYNMLPECIKSKYGTDLKSVCDAAWEYNKKLIDSVYDIIPAVKPQAAFYEMLGPDGMELLRKTCEYAGGELLEIAQLPENNDMRKNGETEKCIYRFVL